MARVASCPQCEHDLLVPDDAAPSALVKCPQCRAFFELQHAESRELPAALVVDSQPQLSDETPKFGNTPTLEDFSPLATPKIDLAPISEEVLKDETGESDFLDFADDEPEAHHGSASLPAPKLADESQEYKPPGTESHEEAAQRIDQWFRSAKTLSDLPPLSENDLAGGDTSAEMLEPQSHANDDAPIEMVSDDTPLGEVASDFELETPSELPDVAAPWDDSQHMDRLLADLEDQPIDTYEPEALEAAGPAHKEHDEQEHFQPAGDWTPDESLSIPAAPDKPERKRSIVRTLAVSAFGGVFGLALGYYALLWLGPMLNRGKEIDFLELAHYLPKSILPPAFRAEPKPLTAAQPPKMVADLAAAEKAANTEPEAPTTPATTPPPAETTAQTPPAPAEKQATFNAPPEPAKKSTDADDRYSPAAKSEPAMREPAPLETPPAKEIAEIAPKAPPVRISNAPSFSVADVTTALAAANSAEPGLVTGNLQDGKEVARTKGISYMAIADLADKATFADAPDAAKADDEADAFFRKLLSNAHARSEVAQIVPRWLSHPKRPQNGAFLAGSVKHVDVRGSMVEYQVELEGGPSVVVVVPATDKPVGGAPPQVGVVGSIIDKPADAIAGYTGSAPQVIFTKKLLPLD